MSPFSAIPTDDSGRIMATRIPRVAAKNPSERTPHTTHRSVLANDLDRVLAACRCKTASRPNQWTDTNLIKPNQLDHAGRKESLDHSIRTDNETSSLVVDSTNTILLRTEHSDERESPARPTLAQPQASSIACSRSARKSANDSSPTEIRINPSEIPNFARSSAS